MRIDGQQLVLAPPAGGEDRDRSRVVQRTTVRPERLTFSGQSRRQVEAMIQALDRAVTNRCFAGVLIHDYPGFFALPQAQGGP